MSDSINIQRRFDSLGKQETFDGYSKIIINVTDDVRYISGTDTGRTLEVTTPFGTQEMADDILSRVQGFQYQPFTVSGAIIDPAVELGDGVSADGLYSGIFSKKVSFGGLYSADMSAPGGEKINYQVPYKSKQDRKIERNYKDLTTKLTVQSGLISAEVEARKSDVKTINAALKVQEGMVSAEVEARKSDVNSINAALKVQAGEISAKVSKTGGKSSSFGWKLSDSFWKVSANNKTVFKIAASGAEVMGKITATSGKIGGIDIKSNYLSYNNMAWGGTNTKGFYLGPSGIQLGKNCKIDMQGNAEFSNADIKGTIRAGDLIYGGAAGHLSGDGLSDRSVGGNKVGHNTISTSNTSSGINTSLGYADYSNGVFNGINTAQHIKCTYISINGASYKPITLYYTNANGGTSVVTVIGKRES